MFLFTIATALACNPLGLPKGLDTGEAGYEQNNPAAVGAGLKTAKAALPCVVATPRQEARYHRLVAYRYSFDNDWDDTEDAFRASIAADPLLPPAAALFRNQRTHLAWIRAQETPIQWTPSGIPMGQRGRPLVPDTRPLPRSSRARKGAFRAGGIGLGIASLALYGGAWVGRARYNSLDGASVEERNPSYRTTNALTIASIGTALVGGTLLAVSFTK